MRILFFHRSRRCCPFLSCCLRMLFLLADLLSHTLLRTDFLLGFSFPIDSFLLFDLIQHECELGRVVGSPGKRKPCYTQRVSPCAESFGKHWPTDHFLLMGRMSQSDGTRTYVGDQLLRCVLSMLLGKCLVLSRQRFLHHTVDHRIVYILSGCFHFLLPSPKKQKKPGTIEIHFPHLSEPRFFRQFLNTVNYFICLQAAVCFCGSLPRGSACCP